jgi:AbrB family transcriptional regulator, transcriptional pleiotropic regulator of transition state genes
MKKAIGITRKMDGLGRIVIPAETRRILNIETGDTVEMFMDDSGVYIEKYVPGCVFCDEVSELQELNGVRYCAACAKKIK